MMGSRVLSSPNATDGRLLGGKYLMLEKKISLLKRCSGELVS